MSLTSLLNQKNSPLLPFFKEHFPNTVELFSVYRNLLRASKTLLPKGKVHHGTIGTAVDYRFRYYYRITPFKDMVASIGGTYWVGRRYGIKQTILKQFTSDLKKITKSLRPIGNKLNRSDEILLDRYCYVLALFEQLYRAGIFINSPLLESRFLSVKQLLRLANPNVLDDICSLSWLFYDNFKSLIELPAVLNPTFKGSSDVGGADADLILNNCLLDFKTTVRPGFQSKWIYQLLGYVLLDYKNQYKINGIGIYFSRQGLLLKWDLEEALKILSYGSNESLPKLRTKFRKLCRGLQS